MTRQAFRIAFLVGGCLLLAGCSALFGNWFGMQRAAWRGEADAQCVRSGALRAGPYIQPAGSVGGGGACGSDAAFRVLAVEDGMVGLSEQGLLNCPMTVALQDWLRRVVQPEAVGIFGQPVVQLRQMGTYNCRRIRGHSEMSEHAFANAIDIGGFVLADGRTISVRQDWRSPDPAKGAFLRAVGEGSCAIFSTVIGPDGDANHRDHFHLDLARHRGGRRVCEGGAGGGLMSYAPTGKGFAWPGAASHDPDAIPLDD